MLSTPVPRVAILVDTSTGWGRRLIRGVANFAMMHGPWNIWLEPRGQSERLQLPETWQGDGVIARVSTRQMAEHLASKNLATVNVSAIRVPGFCFARVSTDETKLAQLTVDHFLDRRILQIGYVGLPHRAYSADRKNCVQEACRRAELPCHIYVPRNAGGTSCSWSRQQESLRRWLVELPKPVGILTWNVPLGLDVINAARSGGFLVPEDIAVLSGDDDELLCETTRPSLSGIVVASEQIGYEAAAVLAKAMAGAKIDDFEKKLSPSGSTARASTEVLAIEDPDVLAAVRFIRGNPDKQLRVVDVANAVVVSRRVLERRFQREFNRTLGDEIARVHFERAKLLLATTDMPIPKVADASGYGSPEYLAAVFRKQMGRSPLKYRIQLQGR